MLVPAGRVLERVGARQPEHPRVAAGALEPVVEALVRLLLGLGDPADEQRRDPVLGASEAAACRTTRSESSSAGSPPSRYCQRDSGETTYGALHVIRSNVSPATGSKRLPSRTSTLSSSFNAALISVNASARGLTSVAITWSLCCAASSAWMPFPVPTSRARATWRRGVSAASHDAVGVYGPTQPTGSSAPRAKPSNAM